jgi:hypothetical protein
MNLLNGLLGKIIYAAVKAHSALGSKLLESIFKVRANKIRSQVSLPVSLRLHYDQYSTYWDTRRLRNAVLCYEARHP